MSDGLRRWLAPVITAAAFLALAVGGGVLAKVTTLDADVREIRLVVRDMAFVDSNGVANPTLRVAHGERIRFVLANDYAGYLHNLIAPVLGVSTPLVQHGKSQTVVVTIPDMPGVYSYECGPHSKMMRGNIAIE